MFVAEVYMIDGTGFQTFGPEHLCWVLACALIICAMVFAYKKASARRRRGLLVFSGFMASLLTLSLFALNLAQTDFLEPNWWPLHVCNICAVLCLVYAVWPTRFVANVLYGFGLTGGLLAIIFPSWGYCPPLCWVSIASFTGHAFCAATPLMLLISGDFRPRRKEVWMPIVFIAVYAAVITPFNAAFNSNFAFLANPSAGSPVEMLASIFGNPGYQLPYAVLVVAVLVLMYLPWAPSGTRDARSNE